MTTATRRGMTAAIGMLVAAILIWGAGPARASIVTFSGADDGAGPGDPSPNSDAAAASFTAAGGGASGGSITFEGLPVGNFGSLGVAPGVTATITNGSGDACAGICATNQHSPTPIGYNTTAGGSQHLRVVPNFSDPTGASVTFSFAKPINAFGARLTDTQSTFPGPITATFNDGAAQSLGVTKNNDSGGQLFFGFTDFGKAISSVTLNTGATGGTRDIWGIDDVLFNSKACGPGAHWVDTCAKGKDAFNSTAVVGVAMTPTGPPTTTVLQGPTVIMRGDPTAGTDPNDATHKSRIDTEMLSLDLTGGGLTLHAGSAFGLPPSLGAIIEKTGPGTPGCGGPADPGFACSFFDVFFELMGPFGTLHNAEALRVESVIDEVPPLAFTYQHPPKIIPLLNAAGQPVAFLVNASHTPLNPIPEPSTLLLLGAGLAGFGAVARRRSRAK